MMGFRRFVGWLALALLLGASRAEAVSLAVTPSANEVGLGQLVSLSIEIAGLGAGPDESLSSFDLDLRYDPLVLAPVSVLFGTELGVLGVEAFSSWQLLVGPARVDLALASLLPSATLDANQPGAFVLATVVFQAVALGGSSVFLDQALLADTSNVPGGNQIVVDEAFEAVVNVVIPEPATILLVGAGLAAVAARRRGAGARAAGR
jgi:hypothetical protein